MPGCLCCPYRRQAGLPRSICVGSPGAERRLGASDRFNANGIDATPNGDALILVNSGLGTLFNVNPASGYAARIDLGGATVSFGDGLLLDGKTLYVVRNQLNQITVIELAADFSSGEQVSSITHPAFDVPTTLTELGSRLYAVDARFRTPPTPTTPYSVVQIAKP